MTLDASLPKSSPGLTDAEKEQVKLTATYLNGIAIGLGLVGGLSLPTTIFLNSTGQNDIILGSGMALFSFVLSPYIHLVGKRWLRRLDR